MDSGGQAAEVGTISGQSPPIDITTIPATTHLFFDDEESHVINVNARVEHHNADHQTAPIQLTSILCPRGDNVVLVNEDGTSAPVSNLRNYSNLKNVFGAVTFNFFDNYYTLPEDSHKKHVGSGFTSDVINQIIAFERTNPSNQRLYFFDFDHLLSLAGVFQEPSYGISPDDYAHFLFSDHVQKTDNPRDRLYFLKQMFSLIGPERTYIITCNKVASVRCPTRLKFIEILRVLLPDLIVDHVKLCNRRINENEVVQDKGYHIVEIIKAYSPSSGGSIKRRRMTSKKTKKTIYGRRSRKYTRNVRRNKYRK